MKVIKLILFIIVLSQLFINQKLYCSDKAAQGTNFIQEAQGFLKNNQVSENDLIVLGTDIANFFDFLKKSGASFSQFGQKLQNKAAVAALATNLKKELDKLQAPLGNFLAQLQAYYTVISDDLNKKGKKDTLKPLNLETK